MFYFENENLKTESPFAIPAIVGMAVATMIGFASLHTSAGFIIDTSPNPSQSFFIMLPQFIMACFVVTFCADALKSKSDHHITISMLKAHLVSFSLGAGVIVANAMVKGEFLPIPAEATLALAVSGISLGLILLRRAAQRSGLFFFGGATGITCTLLLTLRNIYMDTIFVWSGYWLLAVSFISFATEIVILIKEIKAAKAASTPEKN
tara:strand:+ start:3356 stop:3976 length:621 start_codon:yes stop_codon:yes gene_type:complete